MQRIKPMASGAFMMVLATSGIALAGEPAQEHHQQGQSQRQTRGQQAPAEGGRSSEPAPRTGSAANDMDDASAPPASADMNAPSPVVDQSPPKLDLARDEIEQLQRELASRGLYRGPIDGMAGPQTMAALREFHEQMGVPVDTGLDQQTRQALGLQLDKQNVSGAQTSSSPELERPVGREGEGPDVTGGKTFRSQVQLDALPPEQVRTLQTRLQELGFYQGTVDGKFGNGTRSALRRFFQTHADLASRGIITDTGAGMLGLPPRALDAAMNAKQSGFDSRAARGQNERGDVNQAGGSGTSSPEPGGTSTPQPSGGTNAPQQSGSTPPR